MTEKEQDDFFIKILNKILEETKECADYINKYDSKNYRLVKKDYDSDIKELSKILSSVKSIDDLAEKDEETINLVFDYIVNYAENMVISADEKQKKEDMKEAEKLEEIINLFIDDEYDEEDEEFKDSE